MLAYVAVINAKVYECVMGYLLRCKRHWIAILQGCKFRGLSQSIDGWLLDAWSHRYMAVAARPQQLHCGSEMCICQKSEPVPPPWPRINSRTHAHTITHTHTHKLAFSTCSCTESILELIQ